MTSFSTAQERRAKLACEEFCSEMRKLNPYHGVDWEQDSWVTGKARRSSAKAKERIHFTTHAYKSASPGSLGVAFPQVFGDFVRAIVVQRAINAAELPTATAQMVLIRALRYLYEELKIVCESGDAIPWKVVPAHFNSAVQELLTRESKDSCYRVANYLQYVAAQMDRLGLTPVPVGWKHDIERPEGSGGLQSNRVGKRFRERRERLLLSDEALYAVAELSNSEDLELRDLVCQRVVDLLFCSGFRINEGLVLFRDAVIEEAVRDDIGQLALRPDGTEIGRAHV